DVNEEYGLVRGESDYYIARKNWKFAIFDKDGRMISPEWLDWIDRHGLVKGQHRYYVAMKNGEFVIFDKEGNMTTFEDKEEDDDIVIVEE
ncbi:MAG: hypothetical protein ACP5RD_08415, partial [bacterium]